MSYLPKVTTQCSHLNPEPHCQDECVREPWTFRSNAHAGAHSENIKIVIQAQNNVRSSYKEAEWSRCVSFALVLKKERSSSSLMLDMHNKSTEE